MQSSWKSFWRFEKDYLSLQSLSLRFFGTVRKKILKKICRIRKDALSLQSLSQPKCEAFLKWFFELLVIFWEQNCSIYLSISFKGKRIVRTLTKHYFLLQWRVWSWLRMNASGRPNTCKSRGIGVEACFNCRRPAHGCVTRMQPTQNRGITLRNRY